VITMANTPSLKASSLVLPICDLSVDGWCCSAAQHVRQRNFHLMPEARMTPAG
jgi:hypothetical protein